MNQKLYEATFYMKEMERRKTIEQNLVLQCAPLIAGLKVSNLFIIPNEYVDAVTLLLSETQISFFYLLSTAHKTTLLLYHEQELLHYMSDINIRKQMLLLGYQDDCLLSMFQIFQSRYQAYMNEECKHFPHELGFFLGYPLEDVIGFMRNAGQNCLYTGYWKVYGNLKLKVMLFQSFEDAKEKIFDLLSVGFSMLDVINNYNKVQQFAVG